MSFRRLLLELRELSELVAAGVRRRLPGAASAVHRQWHHRLPHFDAGPLLATEVRQARFVVLDTETTGLEPYAGDEIVEIALLEYRGLSRTGREFNSLVNPGIPIPPASTAVHGIRDDHVANAPSVDELMGDVLGFLHGAVLVGHHVGFDLRFLHRAAQRAVNCRLPNPAINTLTLFRRWSGCQDDRNLIEIAEACGVSASGRHTARGDARICGELFSFLAGRLLAADATVQELLDARPQPRYGPDHLAPPAEASRPGQPPDRDADRRPGPGPQ